MGNFIVSAKLEGDARKFINSIASSTFLAAIKNMY